MLLLTFQPIILHLHLSHNPQERHWECCCWLFNQSFFTFTYPITLKRVIGVTCWLFNPSFPCLCSVAFCEAAKLRCVHSLMFSQQEYRQTQHTPSQTFFPPTWQLQSTSPTTYNKELSLKSITRDPFAVTSLLHHAHTGKSKIIINMPQKVYACSKRLNLNVLMLDTAQNQYALHWNSFPHTGHVHVVHVPTT